MAQPTLISSYTLFIRTRRFVSEAEGTFAMHITDDSKPEKTGTYQVRVQNGVAEVEIAKDDKAAQKAGVSLDSPTFAQIYSGYLSPHKALAIARLRVTNEADLKAIQAIFSPVDQPAAFMANEF